jgi:hypothetical protein
LEFLGSFWHCLYNIWLQGCKPCLQILDQPGKKHSGLICLSVSEEEKKTFYNPATFGQLNLLSGQVIAVQLFSSVPSVQSL